MTAAIISTKLNIPAARSIVVQRPRLTQQLNDGMQGKLTLISAGPGSGKTTLLGQWMASCASPAAWLSLDEGDNDPSRFLMYLIAALRTVSAGLGEQVSLMLQSPQAVYMESMVEALIGDLIEIPHSFVLVMDDYHVIEAEPVQKAVALLLEHMPSGMHLVIASRKDPALPLARLRVRNQLNEVRGTDLRFNTREAEEFLAQVMGLRLPPESVAQLKDRTEGWIAGLQLAALSLKGHKDPDAFISSFSGNHRYVLDYLLEEVLQYQAPDIRHFLLYTSILDRFCGSLCSAILTGTDQMSSDLVRGSQDILTYLEQANLFLVPLDDERQWYRYHHMFADLLRSQLSRHIAEHGRDPATELAELHQKASAWYEEQGFELEAFQHAASAADIPRAARLAEGKGMPIIFRGAASAVRNWLESLPESELDKQPSLWVMYASVLLMAGDVQGAQSKLVAAEKVLKEVRQESVRRDLTGHIASIRATLAVSRHEAGTILAESRRALKYLHPDNLPVRTAAIWALGYAHQLLGDRAAARQAYADALMHSTRLGHRVIMLLASSGLGNIEELENRLDAALSHYEHVLEMAGDSPLPAACEAYLGLARISYKRNDLEAAERHANLSVQLAGRLAYSDRVVACQVMLARVLLAKEDMDQAVAILSNAAIAADRHQFEVQIPAIAAVQAQIYLNQGRYDEAAELALSYRLPLLLARVDLARGRTADLTEELGLLREQSTAKGHADELLEITMLQAAAYFEQGEKVKAYSLLEEALETAARERLIRTFVELGSPMSRLLDEAASHGIRRDYTGLLLGHFDVAKQRSGTSNTELPPIPAKSSLVEPLSERELEVLRLIAEGLSNQEISERLFIALTTVKGHNRIIFDKLQVKRRTEAVARARSLGIL
ncbi:LuxR C-terminal-related transcriptional regulator [Paenibacillus tuaregi]|uniref:LuxR C-terminal-related transcriptional regulator n=1 Tax=Paenibacillus tuaregi TaxID=1816681 RepID=UPI000837B3CB|nr:LuxR C-terminal-related transcriptional regulator [Paenibacillus tuaregi]